MNPDVDLTTAIAAVRAASRVCRAVQQDLVTAETLDKKDKSPVTVADFASQAIVCRAIAATLPSDAIVAEEASDELRRPENAELLGSVVEKVRREVDGAPQAEDVLGWIDLGAADARGGRYWTLDPIDGTKGFLRGEQYAIALGLIEDGEVVLGALGCPNLPTSAGSAGETGVLMVGARGGPARALSLWDDADDAGAEVRVAPISSASEARFCESVEKAHSDQSESARIAQRLGIQHEPFRIDSQCKYAAVARNDASIYLRMPTRADYREKIWDHAAGKLVVECAGGRVSDIQGRPLDFTHGRTLDENRGVVATCGAIHDEVIEAIAAVRAEA